MPRPTLRGAAVKASSNGLSSAASAGMHVIAVPSPRHPPDPDAFALTSTVLHDLSELTPSVPSPHLADPITAPGTSASRMMIDSVCGGRDVMWLTWACVREPPQ